MPDFIERIMEAEVRASEIEDQLADPEVAKQPGQYQKLAKALAKLRPLIELGERYRKTVDGLEDLQSMLDDSDPDVAELGEVEPAMVEGLDGEVGDLAAGDQHPGFLHACSFSSCVMA